jgi:peptidoglycan hydrolase-like protein with peptidoglycan-binding domain
MGTRLLMRRCDIKARKSPTTQLGVMVRTLIRKVIIGTASVIALGIAGEIGSSALNYAADANTVTVASVPAPVRTSNSALTGDALRKDDIRWAQLELRNRGLYRGSLDGILGSETRHAVSQFQTINGLTRTASLDAQTWEALTSKQAIGGGPSTPDGSNSTTNSSAASDLGR